MRKFAHLMSTLLKRLWRPSLSLGLALVATQGCVRWQPLEESEHDGITRYITSVQSIDGADRGVLHEGLPQRTANGPVVSAELPSNASPGGTVEVTAVATAPFTRVSIVVPGQSSYWEIELREATKAARLRVTFSENLPSGQLAMRLAGGS